MGTEERLIPASYEPWTRRQLALAAAIAATCAAAGFGVVHAIGNWLIGGRS